MSPGKWELELVEDLTELVEPENPNRAALAHLRRGLEYPIDYSLARVGWLFRRVPDFAIDDALLAAGLFAWVKGECPHTNDVNFGVAFGMALTRDEKLKREKRFIDLLDTDREGLRYKLRQAITLIIGNELDWVEFIRHLGNWTNPDRWVQKEWARGFWSESPENESATAAAGQVSG